MTSLKERVAIVTGAGRGMGRAIAIKLARSGAAVALVDLEAPVESAELAGPSAIAFAADVSSDAAWKGLGEAIDQEFGRADILVNNAAIFPRGPIEDMDFATWRRAFEVNLDAHFHSAKHFVPRMRRNG